MMYHEIRNCRKCSLHRNQAPLVQKKESAHAMWVGLSAVRVPDVDFDEPLSLNTNSGRLISEVESRCNGIQFYKTNLVKCLPLKDGKIRYPYTKEATDCFHNLLLELNYIKPKLVFLLGKQVTNFFSSKFDINLPESKHFFDYQPVRVNIFNVVAIHHPSYILVYKRRFVDEYKRAINRILYSEFPQLFSLSDNYDPHKIDLHQVESISFAS